MSTKFYLAFLIPLKNPSIKNIHKILTNIKKDVVLIQKKILMKKIMEEYVFLKDELEYNLGKENIQSDLFSVLQKIRKEIDVFKQNPDASYGLIDDFDCECVIIPHKEGIVLKLFGSHADFIKYFKKNYKSYEYWNNTDKPDNVLSSEWNKRKDFVNKITKYNDYLQYKLTISFNDHFFMNDIRKDLLNYIPEMEKRVKNLIDKMITLEPDYIHPKSYEEYMDFIQSPKYHEIYTRTRQKIKLKEKFLLDDIK